MNKKRIYFYGVNLILACCMIVLGRAGTSFAVESYRVNGGGSDMVNEWSECRNVANQAGANDTFIPTNTSVEWTEFRIHYPSNINLAVCASTLTLSKAGTGSGTVTSDLAGINCGATCAASYASGTSITLTAAASPGSAFAGWSGGGCSGTGTCTVTLSANTTVTATFNVSALILTLSKAGTGSGTVMSNPAGINCGATCAATFTAGTVVALTPSAAAGSGFGGWSGACTGGLGCSVIMDSNKTVTATFIALTSGGKRGNTAVAASNNKIYLYGDSQSGAAYLYEYDPATNSYGVKTPSAKCSFMGGASADWGAGLKVYQLGGTSGTSTDTCASLNREYDVAGNTWTAKAAPPAPRSMAATATVSNKFYVIGGVANVTTGSEVATNYQYDPATDTWTTKAAMPTSRYWAGAAVYNNTIYVIGGHKVGTSGAQNANQQYNPSTNTWTSKTAMPTARRGLAVVAVGSYIYAISGDNNTATPYIITTNEQYNPVANTWATKAPIPTARESFAGAAVNGKIYAFCGMTASWAATRANEEYDPATNTWTTKAPVP